MVVTDDAFVVENVVDDVEVVVVEVVLVVPAEAMHVMYLQISTTRFPIFIFNNIGRTPCST